MTIRPFNGYRRLAAEGPPDGRWWWLMARRPLFVLLILGTFVSFTTAGRLVPAHIVFTVLFWVFLPAYQTIAAASVARLFASSVPVSWAVDLFFVGHLPWLLLLTWVSGLCLFAPGVYDAFSALLTTGVLPGLGVLVVLWSMLLTAAWLRAGLGASWPRTLLGSLAYYGGQGGLLVGWYVATYQLQPIT